MDKLIRNKYDDDIPLIELINREKSSVKTNANIDTEDILNDFFRSITCSKYWSTSV